MVAYDAQEIVKQKKKTIKYFIDNHDSSRIMTYADRRYSDGNKQLGFDLDGETQPNYFYIKDNMIYSRQRFQKHKLEKKLEKFDSILTEAQNMFNNKYRRIWNAGHFRFLWVKDIT